jgi:protein TorT
VRTRFPFTKKIKLVVLIVGLVFLFQAVSALAGDKPWWPIKQTVYYGIYRDVADKEPNIPAKSLDPAKEEDWYPPEKANKPYMIGVSFPHLKDPFWKSVMYGIISEGRRLGVGIDLVEAGGYTQLAKQNDQVENLVQQGVDGIVLSTTSYTGLDTLVEEITKKGIPVVALINDIKAPTITAKSMPSYYLGGYHAGKFMVEDAKGKEINAIVLPGPGGSAWTEGGFNGIKDAIRDHKGNVNILAVKWGDTGLAIQRNLVENALQTFPEIDYLIGNGVMCYAASEVLAESGRAKDIKLVATHISQNLYEKLKRGELAAMPYEGPVEAAKVAIDMVVRILNGEKPGKHFPFMTVPLIVTLTKDNVDDYDYEAMFGPRNFRPVFKVEPKT